MVKPCHIIRAMFGDGQLEKDVEPAVENLFSSPGIKAKIAADMTAQIKEIIAGGEEQ